MSPETSTLSPQTNPVSPQTEDAGGARGFAASPWPASASTGGEGGKEGQLINLSELQVRFLKSQL